MKLLVTRPRDDSADVVRELEAHGHTCLVAPMIDIVAMRDTVDLEGVQAILATSRNGIRGLAAATQRRDVPVLAVGEATAAEAAAAGFSAEAAEGDVRSLDTLARATLRPDGGKLLWITGKHVRGDLRADLRAAGFAVERSVLYEARAADSLPDDCAEALRTGALDGVLFFSPRSAQTFVRILAMAGLESAAQSLTAFCLSPAIAAAIAGVAWRDVAVATRTDRETLLTLVDDTAKAISA